MLMRLPTIWKCSFNGKFLFVSITACIITNWIWISIKVRIKFRKCVWYMAVLCGFLKAIRWLWKRIQLLSLTPDCSQTSLRQMHLNLWQRWALGKLIRLFSFRAHGNARAKNAENVYVRCGGDYLLTVQSLYGRSLACSVSMRELFQPVLAECAIRNEPNLSISVIHPERHQMLWFTLCIMRFSFGVMWIHDSMWSRPYTCFRNSFSSSALSK